jgi:hypothetical protein
MQTRRDYSDGELEKNDHPPHGMRNGDDDDRSMGGSDDDEDVFIQAAAISGEMQHDTSAGKYQIVDESGPVGVSSDSE